MMIRNLFKKHYDLERFTLGIVIGCVCMCVLTMSMFATYLRVTAVTLSNQAIYTTDFTTSLTQNEGEVEQIYRSEDQTKIFVLMKFENVNEISLDAKSYQVALTGISSDGKIIKLDSSPSGGVYMFGSTGYLGVYLVDTTGFEPQRARMTIRANDVITEVAAVDDISSDSYSRYDQFDIIFNPGGSDAIVSDALTDTPDIKDLYREYVIEPQTLDIYDELKDTGASMNTVLAQIEEYESRLSRLDVAINPTSSLISSDEMVLYDNDTESLDDDVYVLDTTVTLPTGFQFDYMASSIEDGYIQSLIDNSTSPDLSGFDYLSARVDEDTSYGSEQITIDPSVSFATFEMSTGDWLDSDGNLIDDTGVYGTQDQEILDTISELETKRNEFYRLKLTYQTTLLYDLLVLEADALEAGKSFTANAGAGVINVW